MVTSTLRQSIADRRAKQGDKGFTLIELLVVVLIIGILAAIAIPVFLGQQNSAKDGAAKSDIANIKLALVGYYTAGNTTANPSGTALKDYGYVQSTTAAPVIFATSASAFCVSIVSDSGATTIFKSLASSSTITQGTTACTSVTG